jgi:signal transduction histidine kinase
LKLTLDALESKMGAIHLLDPALQELHLVAQQGIPAPMLANIDLLTFHTNFWKRMVFSNVPQIVGDITQETDLPADLRHPEIHGSGAAYVGTPIRVKNQPLGLISIFGAAIKDYTPEDITLLATIADQVGTSIERARLIKQAEQAAVVEERQRLARELHDSVTQLLYSQVLFAGAGIKVLKKGDLPLIQQHLTHIEQAARQALKEMRLLVYELRPSDYLDEGLVGALQRRLDAVEKRTDLNAQLLVHGDLDLDEAAEMALYNIAQEALNNILKHSGATSVTIELCAKDGRVVLEVIDNGSGFLFEDKIRSGGMGLTSMQERTAALGGELQILTQPGQGTRVIATIEGSK